MRRQEEQTRAALCHFFNAIPLWGLIFCGVIWFDSREKSRYLVAQARQAMYFHGALMCGILVLMIAYLFAFLIGIIFPLIGGFLDFVNRSMGWVLIIVYVGICVWGGAQCWRGEPFRYPFVGDGDDDEPGAPASE